MSKNPNVEDRDRLVGVWRWFRDAGHGTIIMSDIERADADGLLVTPLHTRAVEACKEYARPVPSGMVPTTERNMRLLTAVLEVGREALELEEAKKPKERWVVESMRFSVGAREKHFYVTGIAVDGAKYMHGPFTETQARAVAKTLNECDK